MTTLLPHILPILGMALAVFAIVLAVWSYRKLSSLSQRLQTKPSFWPPPPPEPTKIKRHLRVSELEVGEVYTCAISGRRVIVVRIDLSGDKTRPSVAIGRLFNNVTGSYERQEYFDRHLIGEPKDEVRPERFDRQPGTDKR